MLKDKNLRIPMILLFLAIGGCASLLPTYEPPTVSVSAFRVLPSNTLNPKFEIDLHIINPNNIMLNLQGISYSASIEGHKILTGVSNELPVIEAYGEGDVRLVASADLFGSFGLINDLVRQNKKDLSYQLNVKLDVGNFTPAIRVERLGTISFR